MGDGADNNFSASDVNSEAEKQIIEDNEELAGDLDTKDSDAILENSDTKETADNMEAKLSATVLASPVIPKSKAAKTAKLALGIIGAVLVSVYIAISVWFMFHYNYKTYINDMDYSFYTISEVDSLISSYISDYKLTLKLRDDKEFRLLPGDIDLVITPNVTAKGIKHMQNGLLWPYYIAVRKNYELYYNVEYNQEKLKQLLSSQPFTHTENMISPTDAYLSVVEGESVIVSETEGNYIDFDKLCSIIDESLVKGDAVLELDSTEAYVAPEIRSDNEKLVNEQQSLAEFLKMIITFKVDEISFELTSREYGDWLKLGSNKPCFDRSKVYDYVCSIAETYDTCGRDRLFRTHDNRYITLTNNWYGWLLDVDAETNELYKLLSAGVSVEHMPIYERTANAYTEDGDDIGKTYIECDLGRQEVYVYVDGTCVIESDCVSGSYYDEKCRTPEGLYTILFKKTPALLVGEDYETPVDYWMPFIGELGIGFHDATWRGSFGGSIYLSGGSHGCVNLPYHIAEMLYNIVYSGMPVICYY